MARCIRLTIRLNDYIGWVGQVSSLLFRQVPDKLSDFFAWREGRGQQVI
jgi:hypothetical protein